MKYSFMYGICNGTERSKVARASVELMAQLMLKKRGIINEDHLSDLNKLIDELNSLFEGVTKDPNKVVNPKK